MQQVIAQKLNIISNWQNFIAAMSLCRHVTFYTSFTCVQSVRNRFDKKFLNLTMN